MSHDLLILMEQVNIVFMGIFTVEAIIKLIALKMAYFKDSWNCFDFLVVTASLVAPILSLIPGVGSGFSMQATIIRLLRVLRVLRLIKRAQKL